MRVVRAFVTDAQMSWQEVTQFGESQGWDSIVTGARLSGLGFLADKSRVSLTIKPTPDEERRLLTLFNEIAARVAAED